jgi:RNA polymerase sigma-70 factor, ECF subfamily
MTGMPETSVSLLERLRSGPDPASWERLIAVYTPWITNWLGRQGLSGADAEDVVQEVMAVLVRELPAFIHDGRTGAFRRWLKNVTLNRLRVFWRSRPKHVTNLGTDSLECVIQQLEDPHSEVSLSWEREHNQCVLDRLRQLLAGEFEPRTWQAFHMVAIEGQPTAAAAVALGMTQVAVRIAKSRVMSRIRQEIAGLID